MIFSQAKIWHLFPLIILVTLPMPLLMPIMPEVETSFFSNHHDCSGLHAGDDPICKDAFSSVSMASSVTSTFISVAGFLSEPIMGRLSDTYGRWKFLFLGQVLGMLPFLALFIRSLFGGFSLYFYYIFKGVAGFSSSTVMLAYIADISPQKEKASRFGLLEGVYAIGTILSPVLSIVLKPDVAIGLAFASVSLSCLYCLAVPESLSVDRRKELSFAEISPFRNLMILFRVKFVFLTLVTMLTSFAGSGAMDFQYIYQKQRFGLTVQENSYTLLCFGIVSFVANIFLIPLVLPYIGQVNTLRTGLIFQTSFFLLYAFLPNSNSNSVAYVYAGNAFSALSVVMYPAMDSLISNLQDTNAQGMIQGAFAAAGDFASAMGSLAFGPIFKGLNDINFIRGVWIVASGFLLIALLVTFALKDFVSVESEKISDQDAPSQDIDDKEHSLHVYHRIETDNHSLQVSP